MNVLVILWIACSAAFLLRQTQLSFRRMLARVPIRVRCAECEHGFGAPLGALQAFRGIRSKEEGGLRQLVPCLIALARLDKTLSAENVIACHGCHAWRHCTLVEPERVSLAVRRRMARELAPYTIVALMGIVVLGIASWLLTGMAFLLG